MRAILAGTGVLPKLLLEAASAEVVQFMGVPVDHVTPTLEARFEQLGNLFDTLRDRSVTQVCLAGAMARPALDPVKFDPFTARQMPSLMVAMAQGDDALLRAVIAVIEGAGFEVIAAHDIRPDLVAEAGPLVGVPVAEADAARARAVLDALGPLDIGQGAVAVKGQVIGIETLQGTNAMLDYVAATAPGSRGVFVKRPKAGQDLRVDMPAIGPETIARAAAAGLSGIEIAAGEVLLLNRAEIEEACRAHGINLWAGP